MWGPAGLNAGSVLQQAVILGQFGVTSNRQPKDKTQVYHVTAKQSRLVSFIPVSTELSHQPETKSISNVWKDDHVGQREGPGQVWACSHLDETANEVVSQCVCVCVCYSYSTLPSADKLPRVWVQLPEPPCSSSLQSRVFLLQGQTIHSRWLYLRQSIHVRVFTALSSPLCSCIVCVRLSYLVSLWGRDPPSCVGTSLLVLLECQGSAWCPETSTDSITSKEVKNIKKKKHQYTV